MINTIEQKKLHLESALYKWLDEVEKVEQDVTDLLEHNNVTRMQISKDIDKMKSKFATLQNNLKRY